MAEQLSLFGLDAPRNDRLFFGVFPAVEHAACAEKRAQDLRRQHGLRGRPFKPERYHASLYHVGDYAGLPDDLVAAVTAAATEVRMPIFDVAFNRATSFLHRRRPLPFVLVGDDGVVGLMALQSALSIAMGRAGFRVSPGYTPHVTLLYDNRLVAEQTVEPVKWTVRDFVLVHSLLGETRHIPLARFPLQA